MQHTKNSFGDLPKTIIRCIVMSILLATVFMTFNPFIYHQEQGFHCLYGDIVFINRFANITHDDIICIGLNEHVQLSRVIATPKDNIEISSNQVSVNGLIMQNIPVSEDFTYASDQYLVLLDHTLEGQENVCLFIERTAIKGKVILVLRLRDF